MFSCKEAHLGLATTRELLIELEARGRTEHRDEYMNDGDKLSNVTDSLLSELPSAILNYRTVDE
jgi:hypothetical protein